MRISEVINAVAHESSVMFPTRIIAVHQRGHLDLEDRCSGHHGKYLKVSIRVSEQLSTRYQAHEQELQLLADKLALKAE